MDLREKAFDLIAKHNMISPSDEVILGLSGGADSVALFFVLLAYQRKLMEKTGETFELRCVYVHHMIREDADKDVAFVTKLCEDEKVALFVEKRDVVSEAAAHSETVEEAGRRIRYAIFRDYAKDAEERGRTPKIAVAHHMDDQAETVLFNLVRGTGITGLCGMSPVSGDIIRPLLSVTKSEIKGFLEELGKDHVTDCTNSDNAYSRNRLRNEVIPSLKLINDAAVEHIAAAAGRLSVIEHFVESCAVREYEKRVKESDYKGSAEYSLREDDFLELDPALRDVLIKKMLEKCAGRAKDIGEVHVKSVEALFSCASGCSADLPYGMRAYRVFSGVVIRRKMDPSGDGKSYGLFEMKVCDIADVRDISFDDKGKPIVSKKECTKFFDYDKIIGQVHIKKLETSDEMVIDREGHRKKAGRLFIDGKIPAYKRQDFFAICDDDNILWIPGVRDAYVCRVDESTKRVAVITVANAQGEAGASESGSFMEGER